MSSSNLHSAIDRWVDDHTEDLLQLAEALIRFPSVNRAPRGDEKDAQAFVANTLREMNLELDIFEPDAVQELATHHLLWPGRDYHDRPNVVGTLRGAGSGRSLLFSSHIDVVAGSPGGRFSPFEPLRDAQRGRLYGRGSSDMKGGLAVAIFAVRCLQELGVRLKGDVIVESVVDEENGGSNGTLAARLRGHNADACIVAEPNGMLISPAHRGGRVWEISLEGSPGMPFNSDNVVNPAYGLAHLVVALEEWEAVRNRVTPPHPLYADTPGLPVVLSAVQAGDFEPCSGDGVPGRARMEVWAEEYPGTTEAEHYDRFIGYLKSVAAQTPALQQCEMKITPVTRFLPGSEIPRDHPIVQTVSREYAQVLRHPPEIRGAPFACDVFVFNQVAKLPCVILGPRGGNAHAPDEWVMMQDLVALTKIFARTAVEWCGV